MAEGGHDPRAQEISSSSKPSIARHALLAEGDQVIQYFENCTVNVVAGDQYTTVINEIPVAPGSPENKSEQQQIRLEAQMAFLAKTKQHLRNEVGEIKMPARPTTMVIDMQTANDADFRNAGHGASKTVFGRDVQPISYVQFHDPMKGKAPRHVMILGEAGAGKSTISGMYCLAVADGNVERLRSVQLVHYIHAAQLHNNSAANVFDLLFTEQMAYDPMTELTVNEITAGANWLNENSDKVLLTIDGLDQCIDNIAMNAPQSTHQQTNSKVSKIIARIMGGNIWRGVRILTTSRWNIYWNLTAEQKPNKVVGMRGFDDENLKLAARAHSVDGDVMIDQLLNTSLKLLNLCRNPMFLKYTTKIFKTNFENLPDSISGLMSAFFRNFFRLSSEKYDDITKLAYHATLDNIFVFSRRYLENLGINPKDLTDFLSAGANPEKDQDVANSFDDVFSFSHQTMQEFCCALHVPNLDRTDMEGFISNHLNESGMEFTRQLLYGLILNEKVTESMRKYLTGRKTPIEECREMMFEQFIDLVKDGAILDITTVRLLSECGDSTIQKMKEHVQRIRINTEDLLHSDQLLLTILIKRLPTLETTFVRQITLDPSMITCVKNCLDSVEVFEAGYEIMETVKEIHFADVMTILDQSKLFYVRLRCNDGVKLLFLFDWIKRSEVHMGGLGLLRITRGDTLRNLFRFLSIHSIENLRLNINPGIIGPKFTEIVTSGGPTTRKVLTATHQGYTSTRLYAKCAAKKITGEKAVARNNHRKLVGTFESCIFSCSLTEKLQSKPNEVSIMTIEDKSMTYKIFEAYLDIFRHCEFRGLSLAKCDLTDKDVDMILQCCINNGIKLSEVRIWDGTMASDVYCDVATIVRVTGCAKVSFGNCHLTKQKLGCFTATCQQNQISFSRLQILDHEMPVEVYREIAVTLKATNSKEMMFQSCDLTRSKLSEFHTGCQENALSLSTLHIIDVKMPAECFREMAIIVKSISCKKITFEHCELTRRKLSEFYTGCKDSDLCLSHLSIWDGTMTSDVYCDIAAIISITGCSAVSFVDCNLTKKKMRCFAVTSKRNQLSLSTLCIIDAQMPAESFREIAITLQTTCCKEIHFENCELTSRKLSEFYTGCKDNDLSISNLIIIDAKMSAESFREIAITLKTTCCKKIHFSNCELTARKLSEFINGCKENHLSLGKLSIYDGTMTSDIYGNVAGIIRITGCSTILFGECDLTKQKLQSFTRTGRNNKISLSKLHLRDVKMPAECYREIATTLKSISCKDIVFGRCELTSLKLSEFYTGCKDNDLSLLNLCIIDPQMPAESYPEIAITLKTTCCKQIALENCELTSRKLFEFYTGCKDNDLSLSRLNLVDRTMLPDAYYDVANIVKITKCAFLYFQYCDLSIQKLESLGKGCRKSHILIPTLGIDWSNLAATDDHISILCDLMTVVGEMLALFNLEIDAKRKQRLIDTLHLENSKIQRIQFPDGSIHEKRVSARS